MSATVTRLHPHRRGVRVPGAVDVLLGADKDLREIAAEHGFDRDGVLAVAARLRGLAERMRAAENEEHQP